MTSVRQIGDLDYRQDNCMKTASQPSEKRWGIQNRDASYSSANSHRRNAESRA